jgi:hypothetical protein
LNAVQLIVFAVRNTRVFILFELRKQLKNNAKNEKRDGYNTRNQHAKNAEGGELVEHVAALPGAVIGL